MKRHRQGLGRSARSRSRKPFAGFKMALGAPSMQGLLVKYRIMATSSGNRYRYYSILPEFGKEKSFCQDGKKLVKKRNLYYNAGKKHQRRGVHEVKMEYLL
jgi:hypothetical protein